MQQPIQVTNQLKADHLFDQERGVKLYDRLTSYGVPKTFATKSPNCEVINHFLPITLERSK